MKKFYLEYKDDEVVQHLVAQVPCGHNIILMEILKLCIKIKLLEY